MNFFSIFDLALISLGHLKNTLRKNVFLIFQYKNEIFQNAFLLLLFSFFLIHLPFWYFEVCLIIYFGLLPSQHQHQICESLVSKVFLCPIQGKSSVLHFLSSSLLVTFCFVSSQIFKNYVCVFMSQNPWGSQIFWMYPLCKKMGVE